MGEITVVLLLALIFLGPSKLPELAAGLGKIIRDIRKATSDVKNEIVMDESFRKPFEELRDAVTLPAEELKRRDQVKKNMEEARKRLEEEAARAAAAAAAMTPAAPEPAASLPAEAAPSVDATLVTPIEAVVPPVAPPAGTVARNRPVEPPAAEPVAAAPEAAAAPHVPAPPINSPHVVPPVSSLDGDLSNKTQSLSEADLLASAPPPPAPRRPTPPPLPGLSRPGSGRVTPPMPVPSPNATQVLSDNDLLPSGANGQPGVKPPPVPGPKKT